MEAYRKLTAEAERDFEGFWARLARENLVWSKPFTKVLDLVEGPQHGCLVPAGRDLSGVLFQQVPEVGDGRARESFVLEVDVGKALRADTCFGTFPPQLVQERGLARPPHAHDRGCLPWKALRPVHASMRCRRDRSC
jgi:hypothetical protein